VCISWNNKKCFDNIDARCIHEDCITDNLHFKKNAAPIKHKDGKENKKLNLKLIKMI